MATVEIKRTQAANLIQRISRIVGEAKADRNIPADKTLEELTEALNAYGIDHITPCPGEAHSNPNIDNCGVCMHSPHSFGWCGQNVKVK